MRYALNTDNVVENPQKSARQFRSLNNEWKGHKDLLLPNLYHCAIAAEEFQEKKCWEGLIIYYPFI
jgi:hypothetical protein